MKTRLTRITAAAGATALLAGFGAVAATSASAGTPPAAATHPALVLQKADISAYPIGWEWCAIDLLGICINP
jgi:hypothetical protein